MFLQLSFILAFDLILTQSLWKKFPADQFSVNFFGGDFIFAFQTHFK